MGNDFLIAPLDDYEKHMGSLECSNSLVWLRPIISLCDRKRGFGADGVILHSEPKNGQVKCILINSNGSLANFSGNGFACLSSHLSSEEQLRINDVFQASNSDSGVELTLEYFSAIKDHYLFEHRLSNWNYSVWNVGNEHAIFLKFADEPTELLYNDPFNSFDKLEQRELESHFNSPDLYPDGINVGLALIGNNWIQLKVKERGCGWTEACSSGAIAAFLAANAYKQTIGEVEIMQSGGVSVVYWLKPNRSLRMKLKPLFVGRLEYEIKR